MDTYGTNIVDIAQSPCQLQGTKRASPLRSCARQARKTSSQPLRSHRGWKMAGSWERKIPEFSWKMAGNWLMNFHEVSIISFSEVDRMDLLAISELWLQSKSRENCLHRMIPSGRLLQACNLVTWWLFNAQEDSKWTLNLNVRPGAHEQDCSADLARIQSAARSRPRMRTCRRVNSKRCVIMPTRFQRPGESEENTKGPKPGSWPLQGYRRTSQSEGHRPPGILVRTSFQWKDDGSPPCGVAGSAQI